MTTPKRSTIALLGLLAAISLTPACKTSSAARVELDRIQMERATALEAAAEAREELSSSRARAAELVEELAAGAERERELAYKAARAASLELALATQDNGTDRDRAGWRLEVEALRDRIGELGTIIDRGADRRDAAGVEAARLESRISGLTDQVATLNTEANALGREEELVRKKDQGDQVSFWMNLLGTIAGGGALGKLLSKFGPSRSTAAIVTVQNEISALRAAARAYESSPSRGAEEAGRLAQKLAKLEGIVGLLAPPAPVLPTTPTDAT